MEVYILSGGKSIRMGEDKGLKQLNGKPMVEYIIGRLKNCFDKINIVSDNDEYKKFGFLTIEDTIKNKGPMGGIFTALNHTKDEKIFIVSCDMPLISEDVVKNILNRKDENDIIFASHREKGYPTLGIYSKSIIRKLEKSIDENRLKMLKFNLENGATMIDMSLFSIDIFKNVNTPEEFYNLEKLLKL